MGTDYRVVGEVFNESVQLIRSGRALARVLVSGRLGRMDQHRHFQSAGQVHQGRHGGWACYVETLGIRMKLADAPQARIGASLHLVDRLITPDRAD